MNNQEICIWLSGIKGIGNKKIRCLLEYFESPHNIFLCDRKELYNVAGISDKDIDNIVLAKKEEYISKNVVDYIDRLKKRNIRYVDCFSEEYPKKLKSIYEYPIGLYVRGKLQSENQPVVAIVGARNCSEYGKSVARELASELSSLGVGIISGLARGIDMAAHSGALHKDGKTYAVLGCGIDRCYPPENIEVFMECIKSGGVISEYGPGIPPMAGNFPMRNRIISGLADAVLVVEAKKKSGSLITADMALDQGKSVLAVPGRIADALSEGCNNLIYNGATMVLSVADVVKELENNGYFITGSKSEDETFKNITLASLEEMVYDVVCLVPKNIKEIMNDCNLEYQIVVETLIKLELMDVIVQTSKGYYVRVMGN